MNPVFERIEILVKMVFAPVGVLRSQTRKAVVASPGDVGALRHVVLQRPSENLKNGPLKMLKKKTKIMSILKVW